MIVHHPYGIDDPYKRLPTERFPRDPEAGERVQIGFQASAPRAWVVLEGQGDPTCASAQRLSGDLWQTTLGTLAAGTYRYWIHADGEETAGPFALEVGRWQVAERVKGVSSGEGGVAVALTSTDAQACAVLHLSFPHPGVCRATFAVGDAALPKGLPCEVMQRGERLEAAAEGIVVTLNTRTLELTARHPASKNPSFCGSARLRWLETGGGCTTRLQLTFTPGADEAFYGLGERFSGPNLKGGRWDVRVYEEYKEQGGRSYLPVPFVVSSHSYGLWLDAEEPSDFDLSGETCTVTLEKLPSRTAALPLHILVADEPYGVTAAFTRLTGEIQVPPKWAFGP